LSTGMGKLIGLVEKTRKTPRARPHQKNFIQKGTRRNKRLRTTKRSAKNKKTRRGAHQKGVGYVQKN